MLAATDTRGEPDLARMRRERYARLQAQLAAQGLDAILLLGGSHVEYATGAPVLTADAGRAALFRTVAYVVRDDPFPHLFAAYPEGVPEEVPADHVHPPLYPELGAGAIADLVAGAGAVGLDEYTAPMWRELAGFEFVDASSVMGAAKICKTADELRSIRSAQHINEQAMVDVQAALRPGVRQTDLTGLFLRRIFELGATGNAVDPIWQVMPARIESGPWTVHGDVAFPTATTDRILRHGDVVWVDTGITFHGYASDFGRTWLVGRQPTPQQEDQFARWRAVVDAVLDVVKPGASGGDLTRAARSALPAGARTPWLRHFYLIHGVGTDSAEMPLIGTDLGPAFDDGIVLAPGMVLVLEPVIWDDGACGYRSEDIVAVTDDGWVALSDNQYTPFGSPG
ncbi:MAG TPA: Xaa-Pro peptidase family protein [Acidimicrobiales bacterium]|nr:Xaa-Pro peptidase family protein [Acidimicrobiales bacterium]